MIVWILENKQWLFSGLGISIITILYFTLFRNTSGTQAVTPTDITVSPSLSQNLTVNVGAGENEFQEKSPQQSKNRKTLDDWKDCTRILFVDDDTRFKVVKILKKSGWIHTKLIKDVSAIEQEDVVRSDILFIDVQGIGIELGFADEGLGLASALKEKYPNKKVIIYSAEREGDRFHQALSDADCSLAKNADPYEFQKIVEQFTIGSETL